MEVTVFNETEKAEKITFPCIMVSTHDGVVILAIGNNKGLLIGTCIGYSAGKTVNPIGMMSHNWIEEYFKVFKGQITIEQ